MLKFKKGDLVRVRDDYPQTYRGKMPVNFAGEVGWVVGVMTTDYDVCSDRNEPQRPFRDHMWHEQFSEYDLTLVNEENEASKVLGDDYFA